MLLFYIFSPIIIIIKKRGIGDGEWGMGDWGLGPIPNPQSPIPNPQSPIPNYNYDYNWKKNIKKKNEKF